MKLLLPAGLWDIGLRNLLSLLPGYPCQNDFDFEMLKIWYLK